MNFKKILLIGTLTCLIAGPIIANTATFQGVTLIDDNFKSFDGTSIKGTVIVPKGHQSTNKAPLIVFMHGYTASKEFFYPLATEFARHGYVCYSFNARGHQTSGNQSSVAYFEVLDFMTAISHILAKNATYGINATQVGIIGHSHGAMTSTIVGALDSRVNATIPISTGANTSTLFEKFGLDQVIDQIVTLMNIQINFSDPNEIWLRSPIRYVNASYPSNLLLINGELDEAFSIQENKEILAEAIWNNLSRANEIIPGQIYVNSSGLRKLVVEHGVEHIMEAFMPQTFNESITWMDLTFYGGLREPIDTTPIILMFMGIILTLIGGLVGFFVFTSYLASWLYKKIEKPPTTIENIELKQKGLHIMLYIGISAGINALIPLIVFNIPSLHSWIPNLLVDLLGALFIFSTLLYAPILLLITWYEKTTFKTTYADFGLTRKGFGQSAVIGAVLGFAVVGILALAISNFILKLIPNVGDFLITFVTFLPYIFVMELLGRGLIQMKLSNYSKYIEFLGSAIIVGFLQGIGIFVQLLVLVPVLGFPTTVVLNENLPALSYPVIGFLGFTGLYIGLSLFAGWIFQRTRNLIGSTIFITIFLSWVLTAWMPIVY
ncbi:MAG: alpha/beta hydrolase family protein [Candidatus Helarchaeota archaeon]